MNSLSSVPSPAHNRTVPLTFNPAPGWPAPPPGWFPGKTWSPDPSWPPMPPGWLLITLDGAVVQHKDEPTLAPQPPAAPKNLELVEPVVSRRTQDLVTSGDVVYDRSLLPADFFKRGIGEADRAWWDDQFYDALADGDQPRVQALAQGEIDRVGSFISNLHDRMDALGKTEALRVLPALTRDIEQAETSLRHVQTVVQRHRKR